MTHSTYVTITAQVFYDDDEIMDIIQYHKAQEVDISESDAIESLAMERVGQAIENDTYLKVRDIHVDSLMIA